MKRGAVPRRSAIRIRRQLEGLGACGCSPKARQTRDTVDCDRSSSFAIDRVDQCVAFFGVDCTVLVTSAAIWSSVTAVLPNRQHRGRAWWS
jgi:hypothetical protein